MKPRRILVSVINPSFDLMNRYSAVASVIYSFADVLRSQGHEIYVNDKELGTWEKSAARSSGGASSAPPVPGYYRMFPPRIREMVKDLLLFRSTRKMKEASQAIPAPDLVICWISYGNSHSIDLAKHWKVPVISIFDNPISEEYTYLKGFPPFFKRYIDRQEKRCVLNSKALIVYSHAVKEDLIKKYKVNTSFYFKPFTDFKRMSFVDPASKSTDVLNFAYVGSFFNWHRVEDLVEVFDKVNLLYPATRLYLVGDGPDHAKIKGLVSNPNIIFTGRMDGQELDALLKTVHVGVISNALWFQAPVKLFQYSAFGLAVITKNTPTIYELTGGKSCYSFFSSNNELGQEMVRLIGNPGNIAGKGKEAQQHVKENFSESSYAKLFAEIFGSL